MKCSKCGYENVEGAVYCGLCYEPFNKTPAPEKTAPLDTTAPAGPGPGIPPPAERRFPQAKFLKAAATALALGGAVFFLGKLLPLTTDRQPPPGAPGRNRFSEKTGAADKLLADLDAARGKLLADIIAAGPDPEGFGLQGAYTTRMLDLEAGYADAINNLALPCPSCVHKVTDAGYLQWIDEHQRREGEASAAFSARYQELINKTLGGK